jgi:hypothetical protein
MAGMYRSIETLGSPADGDEGAEEMALFITYFAYAD